MNKEEVTQEKQEEERYLKWSKYVYSSKRRIQRRVLAIERDIAHTILQFKTYKQSEDLETFVAFLSCWKFSKVDFGKSTFWCDAIIFDEFKMVNNRTFTFNGHAWIGMTENTSNEWNISCSGTFTINSNYNKLKHYDLYFYDKEQTIRLTKMR